MKLNLFLISAIVFVLALGGCTEQDDAVILPPQIPVESEPEYPPEDVVNDETEDAEEESPEQTFETYDEIEQDNETHELVAEPLTLHLNRDLTAEDIEDLMFYTEIEIWIEAEGIDISLLSELKNLENLTLYQNRAPGLLGDWYHYYISDFSFLNGMNLRVLKLDCSGFEVLLNEIELENLEELDLYYAYINDEEEITAFPNLRKLRVWFSNMKSIDPLCGLNLEYLYINACGFEDVNLNGLNRITTLEELIIYYGKNIELTNLSDLINLRKLVLHTVRIEFVNEIIFDLPWLEVLGINPLNASLEEAENCLERYMEINPSGFISFTSD
ncbi:MAG: hypothetical protein FWE74_06835 [Oscillospiraceae bacterium]|nr:hypothetical protein [Oscillospiraceae bacterium]